MTAPNKSSSPTRTRDRVLQTLYEIDIGGEELEQVLEKHSLERSNTFYKEMIRGIISDKERIDRTLNKYIDRPIEKLDPIERNALRIAIYELLNKKIDQAIAINEAIRLSKKYGSPKGYKFVNAALDNLIKAKED